MQEFVVWYQDLGMHDVPRVGGKNASLGEMISNLANAGVQVPGGLPPQLMPLINFLNRVVLTSGFIKYWMVSTLMT